MCGGHKQVYNNIRIHIPLNPAVTVLRYFFPKPPFANFGNEGTPFRSPKSGFTLLGTELDDGV